MQNGAKILISVLHPLVPESSFHQNHSTVLSVFTAPDSCNIPAHISYEIQADMDNCEFHVIKQNIWV